MVKRHILFNKKINNYTLDEEIEGVKSVRRVPMKFKLEDSTAKYRKQQLKEQILNS